MQDAILTSDLKKWSWQKIVIITVVLIIVVFVANQMFFKNKQQATQYITSKLERGTLISSISATGTVTSGNSTSINTRMSGVVANVYINNGDTVTKGQKIAEVTPDEYGRQREASAWVKYLASQEAIKTADKGQMDADIAMWTAHNSILKAQDSIEYMKYNPVNPETKKDYTLSERAIVEKGLEQSNRSFAEMELKYKNSQAKLWEAQAKVASAWRDYQENSSTIYAPADGIVSDLSIASGTTLTANSTTSNSTGDTIVSSQSVGKVNSQTGQLVVTVNLSEIDVVKAKANQKVNLTLDAYPDKTFTGKVLAINTAGSVVSGVVSYPVSIILDDIDLAVYQNISTSAQIIIEIKTDVLLVSTTAITTNNGQSSVLVKKDGKNQTVVIELGSANDSQTEIVSGLLEGDEVVTQIIEPANNKATTGIGATTSPFGGLNNNRTGSTRNGSSGGAAMPMMRGF